MEYYPDLPSPLLASYIAEVEAATNQSISIAPFPDASDEDELQAAINIGPSYEGIDIKFRPHWPLGHPAIEKALAHELTHGLMIYSMGYPVVDASEDVAAEIVQMAAEVMDLIDDVIIDVMIQERGFPAITPEHLQPYLNNSRILEVAQSRDQISDPHRSDPMATEIFLSAITSILGVSQDMQRLTRIPRIHFADSPDDFPR